MSPTRSSILSSTVRRGFTLMEVMISLCILSSVMVIVTMSLDSSTRLSDRITRQTDINNRANEVLNKLALQLRLAYGGADVTYSLELPGATPTDYTPLDPANPGNVRAYYFTPSTGLGDATNNWAATYELRKRMIIYDYSVTPGHLLLATRNAAGVLESPLLLSPQVDVNGFQLTRIGNTLSMNLTLRSETHRGEDIIYTAQAQTLFLRSTLQESSGNSSVSFVDDADLTGVTTTDRSPAIMFGNKVTVLSTGEDQVSLFITAPIGQKINPKTITVYMGNGDFTTSMEVAEGKTETVGSTTFTRTTYPPEAQWPSQNGTYAVTLTGNIDSTVMLKASAATTDGNATDSANLPSKQYQ